MKALRYVQFLLCLLAGGFMLRMCAEFTAEAVRRYVRQYKTEMENRRHPGGELRAELSIGQAIRAVTAPDERILLLGASPTSVYFRGERLAGSRYYHLSPFFRKAFANSMQERHRQRFISDLKTRKPVLVVLARGERQIYFAGMEVVEKSAAKDFLVAYLQENYVPLESLYGLSKIRRQLGWTWYRGICSFMIRNDRTEEVARRLERAEADSR